MCAAREGERKGKKGTRADKGGWQFGSRRERERERYEGAKRRRQRL